ncbi:CotH kinase family protein [Planktomarina temperata]|nr:CotH kinase family protein [Planktomarina temperata]
MRIVNEHQKVSNKLIRGFAYIGLLSTVLFLLFAIIVTTNRLFVKSIRTVLESRIENVLIGNTDYAVSSISDLKTHLSGAIKGIVDPLDLPQLQLSLKQENLLRLMSARESQNKKWVNASLKPPNELPELKAKVRFKGDRELHSENVKNTSFRVKLRGDDRLFGLEEFSVQRPLMRGYSWELLISKVFEQQGLSTLKSIPIEFKVNGDNRGIYIIEEVPNGRTLERNKRKDGPIFGLDEKFGVSVSSKLDVYEIKKWNEETLYKYSKKVLDDQFLRAAQAESFSSDHFDIEEWAKFFALHDIFASYHGTVPKSVKFYFNPVIGKFQPLLFDAHVGAGRFSNFILLDFVLGNAKCDWICADQNYYLAFLENPEFLQLYVSYLEKYSTEAFIESIVETYQKAYQSLDNRLYASFAASDRIFYRGYSFWLFKPEILNERLKLINKKLAIFYDKSASITNFVDNPQLSQKDFDLAPNLSVSAGIEIIKSNNLNIKTNIIEFTKPTLWILEGKNTLSSLTDDAIIQLKGPVMLVQLNGSLTVTNLVISDGKEHTILNRNWSGVLNIINSQLRADRIKIINNDSEDAINVVNSEFSIGSVHVEGSRSDAIDFDFSTGDIKDVTCLNIGNDCLDSSESSVKVKKAYANIVKDKVISAGENSTMTVDELSVNTSAIALVSKDGASLIVDKIIVEDVDLFAAAFNKKPEYGRPTLLVQEVTSDDTLSALQSKDSNLQIKDSRTIIERLTSSEIEGKMYGATFGVATQK